MTFSPAKARQFIAVLDDILERIGEAPEDFSEYRMSAMFAELDSLAIAIGVDRFKLPIAELQFHSPDDKPGLIKQGWTNPSPRPTADMNGVSLIYRERYNLNKLRVIWFQATIQEGVLRGLPTRKYVATPADFAEFGSALREWKRWAQLQLDEHERRPANAKRDETRTAAADDATTICADIEEGPVEKAGMQSQGESAEWIRLSNLPEFDETSPDWVLSRNYARQLHISTDTLKNKRSQGFKSSDGAKGVHDGIHFWRKPRNRQVHYYVKWTPG